MPEIAEENRRREIAPAEGTTVMSLAAAKAKHGAEVGFDVAVTPTLISHSVVGFDNLSSHQGNQSEVTTTLVGVTQAPKLDLHTVCGFANLLLTKGENEIKTPHLGTVTLPLLKFPKPLPDGYNATLFALAYEPGRREPLGFTSTPAKVHISTEQVHSWDFRVTHKGTLSKGNGSVEIGVRRYDPIDREFHIYCGIAQNYYHVASSLARFKQHLMAHVEKKDFTQQELSVIQSLRFQENLVGMIHENLKVFTAEENLHGPREVYSVDTSFKPPREEHMQCPIRLFLDAFTHWSYEASGKTSAIGGFQGVGTVITEAIINDTQSDWTIGNFGKSMIPAFPREHVCRKFCELQGFEIYGHSPSKPAAEDDFFADSNHFSE